LSMTFSELRPGTPVYLDTNVLVYDFAGRSGECSRLVQQCKDEVVLGVLSSVTLQEFCHVAMCLEAGERQQPPQEKLSASFLRKNPEIVRQLWKYAAALEEILAWANARIIEIRKDQIFRSQDIRRRHGLLTNDSIIAQVMLDHGIEAIATNDPDFERVEGVEVFKPSDL